MIAQVPVLEASQVGKTLFVIVIDEHIFIDPTSARCIGTNGRMYVCRKPSGDRLQVLHDPRTGPIDIRPVFEDHEDIGVIEHGLRAYRFHPRCGQQGRHDRVRNLIFISVGGLTLPVGMNDDLHV